MLSIVCGVGVVMFVMLRMHRVRSGRLKKLALTQTRCVGAEGETVLVWVNMRGGGGEKGAQSTGRLLCDIFDRAACPFRIQVVLAEPEGIRRSGALAAYATLVNNTHIRSFADHVRAVPAATLHDVHRGEKYLCIVRSDCRLVQGWDDVCIGHIMSARGTEALPILTAPPIRGHLPAFLCAHSIQRGSIVLQPRRMPKVYHNHTVPSLFVSTSFAFAEAHTLVAAWPTGAGGMLTRGAEPFVSARLYGIGFRFVTPCAPIATDAGDEAQQQHKQPQACKAARAHRNTALQVGWGGLSEYMQFAGVQMRPAAVSGRAMLGITPDETTQEIVIKYGSLGGYEEQRAAITGKQ